MPLFLMVPQKILLLQISLDAISRDLTAHFSILVSQGKIYVILDICHMLKLARNAFGDIKVSCLPNGNIISWEYVLALHRIQKKDVLHLGTH